MMKNDNSESFKKEFKKIIDANKQIEKQLKRKGVPSRLLSVPANPTPGPPRYTDFTIKKTIKDS